MEQIFNKEQQEKAQFILNHPLAKLSDLRSNEISPYANYFLNKQVERIKEIE